MNVDSLEFTYYKRVDTFISYSHETARGKSKDINFRFDGTVMAVYVTPVQHYWELLVM